MTIIFGWIGKNNYLSYSEMQNNASIIYDYFTRQGWSKNAICAILGNMQLESNINPQIWQNLKAPVAGESPTGKGFGLTQWTPYTKLTSWCSANNLAYQDGYSQLKRIDYERNSTIDRYNLSGFVQWMGYPTAYDEDGRKYCTFTFYDFTVSTKTPAELVIDFMNYYERPSTAGRKETTRIKYANYWWEYFNGESAAILPPGGLPIWSVWSMRDDSQHRLPIYMLCSRRKAKGEL